MEFRWLIFLTLWTLLAGPVLSRPTLARPGAQVMSAAPASPR